MVRLALPAEGHALCRPCKAAQMRFQGRGNLPYRRQKTGRQIRVHVTAEAAELIRQSPTAARVRPTCSTYWETKTAVSRWEGVKNTTLPAGLAELQPEAQTAGNRTRTERKALLLHRTTHMGHNGVPHQSHCGSNKQRTGAFIGKGHGNLSETLRKRSAGQGQQENYCLRKEMRKPIRMAGIYFLYITMIQIITKELLCR